MIRTLVGISKNFRMPYIELVFILMAVILLISIVLSRTTLEIFASQSPSREPPTVTSKGKEIKAKEPVAGEYYPIKIPKKERLSFDISWLGIHAGNAVFEAVNDKDTLRITSRAQSAAFISTFYKVEDYAESVIKSGRATHFRIKQHEGRYRTDKETIFDVNNKRVIYFDYLKKRKKEHAMNGIIWDVISGFYYLRAQPLTVGRVIYIDVFDSNKLLKTEVSILRREKIRVSGMGDVKSIVVKPDLKSEGLFNKKGDIHIWLTDDEKRMPVRVETKVAIGKVVAELTNVAIVN